MRKRLFILTAILFSSINFLSAQITFQKTYGGPNDDRGFSVQQTTDGGYIIIGETFGGFGAGNYDVYLIKTDANGNSLWTKTFGEGWEQFGYSVEQTMDGGYIIAGTSSSTSLNYGVYLIKTDSNGDSLWTKAIGGTVTDEGYSLQQTTDGGYIIAGVTYSFGATIGDVYLIKTDANGALLWTKTFGGTANDVGRSVRQTTDGGYIITGYTNSFGAGDFDIYLIRTDSNGVSLWTKTFGGINIDYSYFVQQTSDGGYIITGNTNSFGSGNHDVYLIKTDSNGDSLWTKTFGGTGDDEGRSVRQTTDGGYIITGYTKSFGAGNYDIYLIKTDSIGNLLWTKTFGGTSDERSTFIGQTTDGGYIITGYTQSFGAGNHDIYLIKTDSLGNSGCNQATTVTIVTSTATQITNPATIVSSPPSLVTAPATIVGSGGIVSTLCTSVGMNEITIANSFSSSPNPSSGNFIISFEETIMKGKVDIYNIIGEKIYTENIFNESKKEIKLKNISSGIYFVKVFDGEKYYCRKIIVEKD